jgi:hypothetical protein
MKSHPSDNELASLRRNVAEIRAKVTPGSLDLTASESVARNLAEVAAATLRTINSYDWSTGGWHLTNLLALLRDFAIATEELAKLQVRGEYQPESISGTENLARGLVEFIALLPGPLRQLGTDIWVELYNALGNLLKANWWNDELVDRLQSLACSKLSAQSNLEERAQFREMIARAFRGAELTFQCPQPQRG